MNTTHDPNPNSQPVADGKKQYQAPRLEELGSISAVLQSNTNTGGDGGAVSDTSVS